MSLDLHKPRFLLPAVLLAILVLPQTASANAGTPLMWGTSLHMFLGNALIGLLEGFILSRLFKAPRLRCLLVMILANYASAWLGMLAFDRVFGSLQLDVLNVRRWFWILTAAAWAATLVIEWPFVAWSLRSIRRSVAASLIVQTASYVLIFGFYWAISSTSLLRDVAVAPPGAIPLPETLVVYYINTGDGNVYRAEPSSGKNVMIHELKSKHPDDRLYLSSRDAASGKNDLKARLAENDDRNARHVEIQANLPGIPAEGRPGEINGNWFNFGPAGRLGGARESKWEFETGFWAAAGLYGNNSLTRETVHLALESPFVSWIVRNAVHLPGDKVLVQLGRDQICIFDPTARRVALLWRGRGPVAVLVPNE